MIARNRLFIATVVLVAGCARAPVVTSPPVAAPPQEIIVVLPGPDGTVGAVVVMRGNDQKTLDTPYAKAQITTGGQIETGRATEGEIRDIFGPALDAQPPRPASFALFFVFGTDTLTPESTADLNRIAREVAGRPAAEIVVIGHTDRVGSDQQNDALSLQRAERIRQELIRTGIAAERIVTVGRGEREPLVPTDDEVAEPRNRRVEITVR
jgi:outer membrane protein OmpA-like peptidoglycan-associated protein